MRFKIDDHCIMLLLHNLKSYSVNILTINHRRYLVFKFFNSMFSGLSIGTVFVIYAPLNPSVYSVGGILLAVATMVIATFYTKLIQVKYFYLISLFVEIVILTIILAVLIFSLNPLIASIVYIGYQITFFLVHIWCDVRPFYLGLKSFYLRWIFLNK